MKKVLLIIGFLAFTAVVSNATLRPRWVLPVNQNGQTESVALPCEPKTINAADNTSSTALVKFANESTTASKMIPLNPPMQFSNGLSVNVSSQTTGVTVCVREADGGL